MIGAVHALTGMTRPERFRLARAGEKISKKSLSRDTKEQNLAE